MAPVSATRISTLPCNRLLAALSPTDLALLQPHLKPVAMELLKERPNRRIDPVYFMEAGIASVVAVQPDETLSEVGVAQVFPWCRRCWPLFIPTGPFCIFGWSLFKLGFRLESPHIRVPPAATLKIGAGG